jgi:WD40 repeat protein
MKYKLKCSEWLDLNLKNKKTEDSIYPIQIVGSTTEQNETNNNLACLTSNRIINIYDEETFKLKSKLTFAHLDMPLDCKINEIGFFKQKSNRIFTCADDGYFKVWDMRNNNAKETVSIHQKNREFLCGDINCDDSLITIGTNMNKDDALVYIYDIRMVDNYLYKFCESHSKDLTQVKFDLNQRQTFCSASIDGLVCLYNLDQEVEKKVNSLSFSLI